MARFEMRVSFPRLFALMAAFWGSGAAGLFASQPPDPAPAATQDDALPKHARLRLGSDRFHHGSSVDQAIYTPDGKSLVTIDRNHVIRVWDAAGGRIVREIGEHGSLFREIALSPDGARLATIEASGGPRLWDVAAGRERKRWHVSTNAFYANPTFSPDGRTLATSAHQFDQASRKMQISIDLWEVHAPSERRRSLPGDWNSLWNLAFSPDGNTLATASDDTDPNVVGPKAVRGSARLFDVARLEERTRFTPEGGSVRSVAFSPDGKDLAYAVADGTVRIRDLKTGQERVLKSDPGNHGGANPRRGRRLIPAQGNEVMGRLAFAPDGKVLAAGSVGAGIDGDYALAAIQLWDVAGGNELHRIPAHQQWVSSLSFSPDGRTLASTGVEPLVRFWDPTTGREALSQPGHRSEVRALVVSPDDRTVFTGGDDGTVRQWDLVSGRELGVIASFGNPADALAVSPDGKTLLVGGALGGRFVLWSIAERREIRELPRLVPRNPVRHVAFSPDGATVASERRIWDVATGRVLVSFRDRDERNNSNANFFPIYYSPDGKQVITTENEGARVWDIASGQEARWAVRARIHHDRTALSPDGRYLATGGSVGHFQGGEQDPRILLWELATGQAVATLIGHEESTNGMSFSPDGRLLASGSGTWESGNDATLRVWDLATSRELRRFAGHPGAVNAVAFTRDGRSIISGSADATALVWDVADLMNGPPLAGASHQAAWDALAGDDAKAAYRAGWVLSTASATGFLRDHLHPAAAPDPKGVPAASGPIAPPETLRTLRALAPLERIATPEARGVLEQMGRGHPDAIETRESRSTLDRLSRPTKARAEAGAG